MGANVLKFCVWTIPWHQGRPSFPPKTAGHQSACIDSKDYLTTLLLFFPLYVQSEYKAYEYDEMILFSLFFFTLGGDVDNCFDMNGTSGTIFTRKPLVSTLIGKLMTKFILESSQWPMEETSSASTTQKNQWIKFSEEWDGACVVGIPSNEFSHSNFSGFIRKIELIRYVQFYQHKRLNSTLSFK